MPFGHEVNVNVQRGFTLVELIAILVIVGIVSVFAIGRLSSIGSSTFSQRALYDKLTASIEYARKMAVAQRRYVCVRAAGTVVTFTVNTNLPESLPGVCAAAQNNGIEQALPMAVPDSNCAGATNEVCAPSGVTWVAATPLTFDATGANITGTTVSFSTNPPTIPTVTVESLTGYVH